MILSFLSKSHHARIAVSSLLLLLTNVAYAGGDRPRYDDAPTSVNTLPSDEDDYQKEIIAKFGDLYFDSSENPEETTSGMAMLVLFLQTDVQTREKLTSTSLVEPKHL